MRRIHILYYLCFNLKKTKKHLDLDSITAFRLGKFDENRILPRLIKVKFKSIDDAQFVIYNNKSFKFPGNISCRSDKTLMQRNNQK